jgi:hypothetical protein
MESSVGVATIGVVTLGIGLSASCLVAFLGSSEQELVLLCQRRNAYRRGSRRGFVCVMSYVIQRVSLNIIGKIIPNPKSLPRLEPRTVFGFVTLVPVISSPKRTKFALAPFFSWALFWSYIKLPCQDSNPGKFFGVLVFVSVTSSSKQTTLVQAPFFYRA